MKSMIIFSQFYRKRNRNKLEIVLEANYGLHVIKYFKILSLKFGKRRSLVTKRLRLYSKSCERQLIQLIWLRQDIMTRFMLLAYLLLKKLFIHNWNFVNDLHFALNMLTNFTQFFFFCLPLKISKSLWLSELFRNDKKRTLRRNGFNYPALKTIANQKLQGNLKNLMVIELRRISHNTGFL